MGGALLLFVALLGTAVSVLVLRADPRRWDNRLFAAVGLIDAGMAGYRGVAEVSGYGITHASVLLPCGVIAIVLGWASVEFAWSFPFNRPAPWRARLALLSWMALALLWMLVLGDRSERDVDIINLGYFAPLFVLMIALLARNTSRWHGDRIGLRLVAAALGFRWASAMVTYGVARRIGPEAFDTALWIEATAGSLLGFVLIGHAILRGHLFSIRGVVAELAVEVAFALAVIGLSAAAIEGALTVARGGASLRLLLIAAAAVPLVTFTTFKRMRERIEGVLPRTALRRGALARMVRGAGAAAAEPAALVAAAREALIEVSEGGQVHFLRAAQLPPSLVDPLTCCGERHLMRGQPAGLSADAAAALASGPGDLLVPVRAGDTLFGALAVSGGRLDRDTLLAGLAIAEHLALSLENHRLFSELEESRRLATLGQFAAAIAHDIRTPLTSVQMNVQILRGKADLPVPSLSRDDMEYFDIALAELKRLNGHISEILDYAKPVQLHTGPADLREIADDAVRKLEPLISERHLVLAREHAAELPRSLCDPQRIEQVLWNLLDNAARASAEGGSITLRTRRDGGRVAIEVSDAGRGIAADDLPRIFEPFFTTRADGTGLGLAICQKLVRAHAGEIQVRSEPEQGTTFTVLLPAAQA